MTSDERQASRERALKTRIVQLEDALVESNGYVTQLVMERDEAIERLAIAVGEIEHLRAEIAYLID